MTAALMNSLPSGTAFNFSHESEAKIKIFIIKKVRRPSKNEGMMIRILTCLLPRLTATTFL
jgi:hypothetical protein